MKDAHILMFIMLICVPYIKIYPKYVIDIIYLVDL